MINISYYKNGVIYISNKLENEDYYLEFIDNEEHHIVNIYPKKEITLKSFALIQDFKFKKGDQVLVNGYQSWTDTREFNINESLKTIKMPSFISNKYKFKAYGDYSFKKTRKHVLHGYTYAYLKRNNIIQLYGSLNYQNAYLIINYDIKRNRIILESDCENKILKDKFTLLNYCYLEGKVIETQQLYFSKIGNSNHLKLRGYTSWYNYYQDINEEKIDNALEGIDDSNYDIFQIDDGYETFVGDWLKIDQNKFPQGLSNIVKKIHNKNLKAGIWLAPFIVEEKSEIFNEHPDWIYKENNQIVYAGKNWSRQVPLDINNKEVREYIKKCLNYYLELGFDFFKLDFLYAANLVKVKGQTRAETMYQMMSFIRNILKDKLILGCGLPLESGFNLVDYCRIGPDVSLSFDDIFYMRLAHRERISTKITLLNTIYRYPMDKYVFRNDPDVYLLRDDNINLSNKQKEALLKINFLCGALYFTSDNVINYNLEKRNLLFEASKLQDAILTNIITKKEVIILEYMLNGKNEQLIYNFKKGVIENG